MIPEPLERLTHAPPFSKLHEYKLNSFANPLIGMKDDFTHGVEDIANRKPFEQLTAARFGLLARLQSLPKDLKLDDAECPLDAKN